ncbi:glutamate decarboxylase [Pyricularia oryzae]|nr:glutamate decarboxylase [Pyricularia oryzae]
MVLSRHVNPDDIVQHRHNSSLKEQDGDNDTRTQAAISHLTPYSSRYASNVSLPKYKLPKEGAEADTVYSMIRDELDLDGKPNLNLASFVGTYLEDNAQKLMVENIAKNLSDADEYPAMISMQQRCVSILAHLWNVQKGEKAIGSATTGSSEAIQLGGLAMKRRWQEARRAAGKDDSKPNIIMGANAQVALEKFARYFDVEARILPVSEKSRYRLDADMVRDNIDENTIGIFIILGSTYTGHYEPIEEISEILDKYQAETGHDIPIHVDGASGAFIAPFTHAQAGGPKWDFSLPRVKSINTSGHKYGLVTAGVGWIVWRDESFLPKHLIFELHYLGGTEESYTLNFSRPGAQVITQYFNLVHLGFSGYRAIMENCLANARLLSKSLEATGWYTCVSDIHRRVETAGSNGSNGKQKEPEVTPEHAKETSADYVAGLPVVAFCFSDEFRRQFPHVKQETVSVLLRARQWIIPNYALPPNEEKTEILRVVVRESMSLDLLDRLLSDICEVTQKLMDEDELDLNVLQGSRHKGPCTKADVSKEGRAQAKKERDDRHKKHQATGRTGRMETGVHRSTC